MKTGRTNKKYSAEFKIRVILDMRENGLSQRETIRKHWGTSSHAEESLYIQILKRWERIYLEEGVAGFMTERRGKKGKGRPKKNLDKPIEEDLIAENQRLKEQIWRLEMENEYLKKLDALVRAEEQKSGRKPK